MPFFWIIFIYHIEQQLYIIGMLFCQYGVYIFMTGAAGGGISYGCHFLLGKLVDKNNNYIQRVYDFAEDKNKRLWIATMGFGLFYYDLKTKEFTSIQSRTSLINEWIGCLHYSDDNKLYVGTYDGINCIDIL